MNMTKFRKNSISQYFVSLFSAYLLWGSIFCRSSHSAIIRTGISSTSPTTLGGFIQWRANGNFDLKTTFRNSFWEVNFSARPSQTLLSFTHTSSTEPGELRRSGPVPLDLGFLTPGSRRVVERGFRHYGGSSDDADFYRVVVSVSRNGFNQIVFNDSGHFPISSRPGVPVFTLPNGGRRPPVVLDM